MLRKDNSPSVLKRRVELLEDDVRRLTTESEQKTAVIDTQEKKIEKLTDEQIELQVAWWCGSTAGGGAGGSYFCC